jgi:hypothetical protein
MRFARLIRFSNSAGTQIMLAATPLGKRRRGRNYAIVATHRANSGNWTIFLKELIAVPAVPP